VHLPDLLQFVFLPRISAQHPTAAVLNGPQTPASYFLANHQKIS
jgi:hypothetical protein